jgi:hypothetical protein
VWIAQLIDRSVSRQRGWDYLKQMRYQLRVPRPEYTDSSPQEQEEWQQKFGGPPSPTNQANTTRWRRGGVGNE